MKIETSCGSDIPSGGMPHIPLEIKKETKSDGTASMSEEDDGTHKPKKCKKEKKI